MHMRAAGTYDCADGAVALAPEKLDDVLAHDVRAIVDAHLRPGGQDDPFSLESSGL